MRSRIGISGIVGNFIGALLLLIGLNASSSFGTMVTTAGISIGMVLGLLGIFGVAKRLTV